MSTNDPTGGDELRSIPMSLIWGGVFFLVAVGGGFLTSWDALLDLIENEGVSDEGIYLLGFVAEYTLPLTIGTALIAFLGAAWSSSKP